MKALLLPWVRMMAQAMKAHVAVTTDRKSTRLNSSHGYISYAVFCLKKTNRPRRRLDARDLVGAPQLSEAPPFDAAAEVPPRHLVPAELQCVGCHPLLAVGPGRPDR